MDQTQGAIDQTVAETKAQLEEMARKALERADRDRELAARIQEMTATASSKGQEVVATVNHGGHVTDLRISAQGMALTAEKLSGLILETIRQAGATVGRSVGQAVQESWGVDNPAASQTIASYEIFGTPSDEETRRPSQQKNSGVSAGGQLKWNR